MISKFDPSTIAKLTAVKDKLHGQSYQFATDLIYKHDKYKGLSEKQWYWVGVLITRANEPPPPKVTVNAGPGADKLTEMFKTAKVHLKHPKITFVVDEQVFQLSMAGPKAQYPGSLNITDGRPFGVNQWFGRIVNGEVQFSFTGLKDHIKGKLTHLIKALGTDPESAAAEYGKLSGRCCFCNKSLTDENSTDVGYGPVCAAHYGLKWGTKAAKAVPVLKDNFVLTPVAKPQEGAPGLPRGTKAAVVE